MVLTISFIQFRELLWANFENQVINNADILKSL
jgi:hypothetical protein